MHDKFNCFTVNFERTQHGIYMIQNFIISIHAVNRVDVTLLGTTLFGRLACQPGQQADLRFTVLFRSEINT